MYYLRIAATGQLVAQQEEPFPEAYVKETAETLKMTLTIDQGLREEPREQDPELNNS